MKTPTLFLALGSLLSAAHAQQTPAASHKTADQGAAPYEGPKVVKDSKALGKKMVQKSKPTDMHMPIPVKK
ncbi:hypothetical protein [Hymenobacter sp. BRD67]|uniref:hypothetical protein n=1 Tax=Hymenobacter sp. BRD67 TaxID=2675877 RepID=UPI0015664F3B|nr:hypothetical protein [Hymenobacter sp. BRD67]QKG52377.1 hypothetical protein GKZ67_06835 [Hymenobacter sp. BRD67]